MESFITWGKEKRKLNHIIQEEQLNEIGLGTVVAPLAAGVAYYLWQKGRARKEKKDDFWVFKKDAPEGEQKKVFSGKEVVRMVRTGELKADDLFYPPQKPGPQNWMKISDGKRFLPFNQVSQGKATDRTIWWAWIDGQKVKYDGSKAFAQAVAKRDIKPDTKVFRNGYDDWLPYSHKDVQDDIHKFVRVEPPTLGAEKLIGKPTLVSKDGKQLKMKFEDLATLVKRGEINANTWIWIKDFNNGKWIKFKEVEKMVPSMGQAPVVRPRGTLGKIGKWMGSIGRDKDDSYIQRADDKARTPTP
jgi:hypothetical protein